MGDNDKKSKVEKVFDVVEVASNVAGSAGRVVAAGGAALMDVTPAIVPFIKFLPLISEIGNALNELIEIEQAAEHNKRTCKALLQRVYAADLAVLELKVQRNKDFFSNRNYLCLQNLVNVITQIKKFASEISQMKTVLKYIQAKSIEKTFKELCKEFDSCINILNFTLLVKDKILPSETEQIRADQEEFNKYMEEIVKEVKTDVRGIREDFSSMILKINTMNNTMEKILDEQNRSGEKRETKVDELYQLKIDKIFTVQALRYTDYKETETTRKEGRVTKYLDIKNEAHEFAFKTISDAEDRNSVKNQVTILKEFKDWQNIIKFYGLANYGNKWYLVTEWAECGNLREYYTHFETRFNDELKLRISLDIARGLNFLRSVEIVHRDIRAKNILITYNDTAKLANFKLSRSLNAATLNQGTNLERIRYCAPELLERAPNFKYDHRCEVYSFGILLWEIAEKKIPYEHYNDIMDITELVRNRKYREPFSPSTIPEEFKALALNAVHHDPDFRPKITEMFNSIKRCFESLTKPYQYTPPRPKPPTPKRKFSADLEEYMISDDKLPDSESFNYMTLTEAEKQHRLVDKNNKLSGDLKTAYKCFDAYAKLNQIKAKYYKAYYISKGYVTCAEAGIEEQNKDKIVADLFKEVADDEANEFPEAKLRYGDCLYNGKGVKSNWPKALEYFEKAAENGLKVAMYNAGNLHFKGIAGMRDEAKAIYYMKLAAYNEYVPAIKFCKEHNIL